MNGVIAVLSLHRHQLLIGLLISCRSFARIKLGLFMVEMYSLPSSIMHGYGMIFYYQFFFTINKKLPLALEFNLYTYPLFE
jgi:hypothetical protein